MKKKRTKYASWACGALFLLPILTVALAAELETLVESCVVCHGKEGASTEPDIPIIGGVSAEYLKFSLEEYKNKERPCIETEIRTGTKKGTKTDMCQVASDLSDGDFKQLIDYFSAQKFVRTAQPFDAELAEKGKAIHNKSCEKCHSEGGSLASDDAGILAGQKMRYLSETFKSLRAGDRSMSKKMKPKIEALDNESVEALVHFYGSAK
jgi:sulfide dehydrogenase cytochrome subunit